MSRLLQTREQLVYSPQLVTQDSSWAYVQSFNQRPYNLRDLDSSNYKISGANQSLHHGKFDGSQGINASGQPGSGMSQKARKEPIDRFASIIDAEDPRFEKQRRENQKVWESNIQSQCNSMNKSVDSFYNRKTRLYHDIVRSSMTSKDQLCPQVDMNELPDNLKDLALSPWLFQTLPGTKPSQWSNPQQLASFVERLANLPPASFWNEPLEMINGGPEFFTQAKEFIMNTGEKLNQLDVLNEATQEIVTSQSNAITALFGVSIHMANYEKILDTLNTLNEFQSQCKHADQILEHAQPNLKKYLNQMVDVIENQKSLHYLQSNSVNGVISIAKHFSVVNLNENCASITTDGKYIYLLISIAQRGCMYRIGTGEQNTIAGKVYLSVPTEKEGEITWVYCQGKLYSRRANEELGSITIIDPVSLKIEGVAKLYFGDSFQNPAAQSLNRYYPLLSDGKSLFVVTMNIAQKRRKVKDGMRKLYQQLQEHKKKLKEEEKAVQKPVAEGDAKAPSQAVPLGKKMRKVDEIPQSPGIAAEKKNLKDYMAQVQGNEPALKGKEFKNYKKNLLKQQKAEMLKKAQEMKMKEQAAASAPAEDGKEAKKSQVAETQDIESYKVCEFYVLEFDMQSHQEEEIPLKKLLENDLVIETFNSFSGFFTYEECYRALKFHNDDIMEAVAWLVDEGEKDRGKKSITKKRSVLLGESEIVSENQSKKNEVDIVVKQDSVLYPTNVQAGKWTINQDQITYHNLVADNGYVNVFSLKQEDQRVINQKEISKHLEEFPPLPQLEHLNKSTLSLAEWSVKFDDEPAADSKVEKSDIESQKSDSVNTDSVHGGTETIEITITEDDLYEEIRLYGTFIKQIKMQRNTDFNNLTYLTYDHVNKRFYFMLMGNNLRYIAVAQDLTQMETLLKDVLININEQEQDQSKDQSETTSPSDSQKISIKNILEQEVKSINEFVIQVLKVLKYAGLKRFNLQWRWRPWSYVYMQVLQQWLLGQQDLSEDSEDTRKKIEQRKKQEAKLNNRLDKVISKEQEQLRERLNISYEDPPLKLKQTSKKDVDKKKKDTIQEQSSKRPTEERQKDSNSLWGTFEYNNSSVSKQSKPDYVVPKEKIVYQNEAKKLYSFCVSGDIDTLKILIKLLESNQDENQKDQLLLQVLDWILYADVLVNSLSSDLVEQLYTILIKFVNHNQHSQVRYQTIWKCLIIGWPIFVRNTQKQNELFNLILDASLYQKDILNSLQFSSNNTISKLPSSEGQTFYQQLLGINDLTPIELFYLRFYFHPATQFPLEILLQQKVMNYIFLVENEDNLPEDQKQSVDDVKAQQLKKDQTSPFLKPRYDAFYQNQASIHYQVNQNITIKYCKILQEKEVDVGPIHYNYFNVPNFLMLCTQTEILESLENYKSSIPVERFIKYYTDSLPDDVRKVHQLQSEQLMERFQKLIIDYIQDDNDQQNQFVLTIVLKIYNEVISQNVNQIDYSRQQSCEYAISQIQFIDQCLQQYQKKTSLIKSEVPKKYIQWLLLLQDHLQGVLNLIYQVVDFDNFTYFAKETSFYLIRILENFKSLFQMSKPKQLSGSPSKKEESSQEPKTLLEKAYVFLAEGADFTYEKIFETPHPYPRVESIQKDSIYIPKAIAFSIEIDKRSQTESNNDSLCIYSQDHAYWVNDTFGTNIKLYGKHHSKYPLMILGNKLNIEFRSYSHGKGSAYRGRGGRGGGYAPPRGNEDSANRWGFKVLIRPIYGEPFYYLSQNLTKDMFTPVYNQIGGEDQITNLVSLMNQLFYTTSKFSRAIIQANLPRIHSIPSSMPPTLHNIMVHADSLESTSKYMDWHLFKGGIRSSVIDQLQNPQVLDSIYTASSSEIEKKYLEQIRKLEQYHKPQIQDQSKLKRQDSQIQQSIIKEGEKINVKEFESNPEFWTAEVKQVLKDEEFLNNVLKKVRELVPYTMVFSNEKRRPNFKKSFQEEWQKLEQLIIVAMLYHSNSIEESKQLLQSQTPQKSEQVTEKFHLIGTQLNDIISWMQSRLQGEQDFQNMLRDIVEQSQAYICKVITKKREEEEERLQQLEALRLKNEEEKLQKEQEDKLKMLEEEKKEKTVDQKKGPVVSKSKPVKHAKRKNVVKMAAQKVDLSKINKDKNNDKALKEKSQQEQAAKVNEVKEEAKKEEDKKEAIDEQQPQKIKYLQLPKSEENDIKNKIYNKVYEEFLQFYQGNQDRVKPLCLLLNITFNAEDPNESLKAIFKRVKAKLITLIDFEGDIPLRETLDIEELNLQSPYQEIRKDVQQRILFLFELKPSVDYHSKVIKVDTKTLQKRFQMQAYSISQMSVDENFDNTSQGKYQSSFKGDDDSDTLEPLGLQRSQSVQVGIQPSLNGIAGVSQAVIAEQSKMKDDEIVNWIDNYRKWRQWNRQHNIIHKHGGLDLLEEDLTSPFCSPLYSIVAFTKSSKIIDSGRLRQKFLTHQMKAGFRSIGMKILDRLLQLSQNTPFQRFVWGNLSITLHDNVMNQIETSGEKLSQSINENSRQLLKQLFSSVIDSKKFIQFFIYKKIQQAQTDQATQSKQKQPTSLVQPEKLKPQPKTQTKEQPKQNFYFDETVLYDQMRRLLQNLNDIRILLNNVYTKEYILESIRQTYSTQKLHEVKAKKSKSIEELNYDAIYDFLKSVIQLMLFISSFTLFNKVSLQSLTRLQFSVSNCCKLILSQFMTDKSMMRAQETQKIIQEMLLDIIVEQLEHQCGIKQQNSTEASEIKSEESKEQQTQQQNLQKASKRMNRSQLSDEIVQLLKLLSEVIRISDDQQIQQDVIKQANISDQESNKEGYFLSEGSDKVMRCAQILAFLMHNTEIPIVMRQTIKCAKLFFKFVDFKKLKLHYSLSNDNESKETIDTSTDKESQNQFLIDTLKKIGQRISNTKEAQEEEKKEGSEKLYVVYGNVNSSEEDYSFLLTALYHWENMYPTFTQDLPKDPSEIIVKPKVKEEEKKEVLEENGVSHESQAQKLLQQIQEADSNIDLQELINMQRQQQQASTYRGRGGFRGGRGGMPDARPSRSINNIERSSGEGAKSGLSKYGYQFGQSAPKGGPPGTYSYSQSSTVYIQTLSLFKVDQTFQEIVRITHEDCKEEDSKEEQLRKLNEGNFNIRVQAHLKDTLSLAAALHHRYTAPLTEPLPYNKAVEFSILLQKAYKGQLEPIPMNPFIKEEHKEKKLASQKSVSECFPLLVKTIEGPKKAKDLPPGAGAPILIAPKQFVVSLAEKRVFQKYETIVETKTSSLKALEKNPIDGFSCNVITQSIRRQGASISIIIQHYIQLLRSMITKPKRGAQRSKNIAQNNKTIILPSDNFNKQQNFLKMKQQQQSFGEDMIRVLNNVLLQLCENTWKEFGTQEKQLAYGILSVIGGWYAPYRTGQNIQIEINNQWVDAIVVDDGLGKKRISVILEDDETLQLQKIPSHRVRTHQKYQWPFDSDLSKLIDQEKLCNSVISVYKQLQDKDQNSNELGSCDLTSNRFLLMQLLKVTSQIQWHNSESQTQKDFIKLLGQISNAESEVEEKSQAFWEKQLIDSWERIIDKDEIKNNDFFVIREFPQVIQSSLEEEKIEDPSKVVVQQLELQKQISSFKQDLQTQFVDSEFVQPLSSYLKGLPEPIPKRNQSEAALKLLAHWEKSVIPKIVEFVRTTYKPWEMEFYFEQLRHHLRNGDQMRALDDAMTMCERKLPQGCNIPDDNHDWTAKMADECIVDTWALAKFKTQRQLNQNSNQAGSQQNQSNSQGDTNYPLLNKIINYGIDEIVILIKAVDNRANVILAEYQDPDTMQVHSIWIPISYLNDLQTQLPPRAVGYTIQTLKKTFERNTQMIDKVYAKQTLIRYFESTLKQQQQSQNLDIQLQDIISWSVQEKYCDNPIDGWMTELTCAIPFTSHKEDKLNKTETAIDSDTISTSTQPENLNLQEMVHRVSENIIFEQLIQISEESQKSQQSQDDILKLIQNLIDQKIETFSNNTQETQSSSEYKTIQSIVEQCALNWFNLSERVKNDRIVMDICQQYDKQFSTAINKDDSNKQQLMPLHELMPENTSGVKSQAAGTLIMFKKSGAHLTPTSKIQFYSDPDKVNLVSEISAGQEGKRDLPPLLLNHGQIWVNIDSGTTALLPKHQQLEQKSSLPCAIVHIPQAWTVCCWLTETLSNSFLNHTNSSCREYAIDTYSKLIGALSSFYQDAKAPSMLKSIVFNLITRLIRKLRFIYQEQEITKGLVEDNNQKELTSHLSKLFINQEFIETLLCELLLYKEQEEQSAQNQGNQQILFPAFVQDCVELIITIMLPSKRHLRIQSFKDLIDANKLALPDWIQPLIKVAYLMHYFSSEMPLSVDLLKEIYSQTQLTHSQLDQIMIVQNIPTDEEKYPKSFIKEKFLEVMKKHGARILNPSTDIIFVKSDSAVIIVDGFDHMAFVNQEEGKLEAIVDSDEEQDEESSADKKKEEKKDESPLAQPTEWECIACTFLNSINIGACDVCTSPRPPMEVIIANFQAQLNIGKEPEQNKDEEKKEEAKSQNLIRLEHLAQELTLLIKREERKVIKAKKQKDEEERKAKEEEERKVKEEEERIKKEKEAAEKKQKEEEEKKQQQANKKQNIKDNNASSANKKDKKGKKQKQQEQQQKISPQKAKESGKLFEMQHILELQQQEDMGGIRLATEMSSQQNLHSLPNLGSAHMEFMTEYQNDSSGIGLDVEDEEDQWAMMQGDGNSEQRRERTKQKLMEMGMDAQMLEQDPDLLEALLESMMAEEQIARQRAQQAKAEEDERRKRQQEEDEKRKKKEEEEKKRQEMGEEAYQALKPKYTKLKVLVGKNVVFEDIESSRLVYKVLRDRLQQPPKPIQENQVEPPVVDADSQEFHFSSRVQAILAIIHQNFQTYPLEDLNELPQSQLLEDFDITKDSIKESSLEEFLMKLQQLVDTDVKLFMMVLETQGYDFWFEKVSYPTYIPQNDKQAVNIALLEKLKTFIEIDMCRETKGVQTLNPNDLRLLTKLSQETIQDPQTKETVKSVNYYDDILVGTSYPEINETLSLADIRYLWSLIKIFNQYLAPAVPYINTSQSIQGIPNNSVPLTLSAYMSFTRNLCLMNVKFDLRHLILEKTSATREHAPKLYFERLKLAYRNREFEEAAAGIGQGDDSRGSPQRQNERNGGDNHASGPGDANNKKDKRQMDFMFIQAYEQIKDMDLAQLRPKKPSGAEPHLSFHIIFRGEHVVGEGGPYRQFFADISQELQPAGNQGTNNNGEAGSNNNAGGNGGQTSQNKMLNLLYPSANNRSGSNIGKGKFVLSPSRNTSQDLSLFEFLGILMGVCIRTGAHLNLDLPQFVWKQLVGQKLNHEDLIEIDIGFWKLLSFMVSANKKLYDESIFETWSVTLSDETLLELREQGKETRVEYEDRLDYVKQAIKARLSECSLQCEAIKRGISKIVPEALLNMVTYNELDTWVCGKNTVDVDLLKRHTKYGGDKKTTILNEDSRRIKWFWEVLREFTEEDKQKFIKFCWGQQRLPANDEEFIRRQVRFMIKPAMKNTHGDGALPKADTCFFNLELPDYSSQEIMKQRILLAIYTDSDSMNAEAEHAANMNMGDQMGGGPGNRDDPDQSYDDEY
eukprot:403336831